MDIKARIDQIIDEAWNRVNNEAVKQGDTKYISLNIEILEESERLLRELDRISNDVDVLEKKVNSLSSIVNVTNFSSITNLSIRSSLPEIDNAITIDDSVDDSVDEDIEETAETNNFSTTGVYETLSNSEVIIVDGKKRKIATEIKKFTESVGATPLRSKDIIYSDKVFRRSNYFLLNGVCLIIKLSRIKSPFWGLGEQIINYLNSLKELNNYYLVLLTSEKAGWVFSKSQINNNIENGLWPTAVKEYGEGFEYKIHSSALKDEDSFSTYNQFFEKIGFKNY
jgi:hypothetical protein